MITLNPADSRHKAMMYRLLNDLLDNLEVSSKIVFKGGTCAAMSGFLDRFSVDLDFDLVDSTVKDSLREKLHLLFSELDLQIDQESKNALQFFLKYDSSPEQRNTLKLEITDSLFKSSQSELRFLPDIRRVVQCHTKETMVAHKLVALTDRYYQHSKIAGRDLYDIHHFLFQGYGYSKEVIEERTQLDAENYLKKLVAFIDQKITTTIIDQDLNTLLPSDKFRKIRKVLKSETLLLLEDEITRLKK